jgi:predicted TIM-barrel fold metal-dependent hydrolase
MSDTGVHVIDADSHVEECDETFSDMFFDLRFAGSRPRVILEDSVPKWAIGKERIYQTTGRGGYSVGPFNYQGKRFRSHYGAGPDIASAEMRNPNLRVEELKAEGVFQSVIYPTLFLKWPLVDDLHLGAAMCRSYNNWISGQCAHAPRQLMWASVVPLEAGGVDLAIEEMSRANGMGAVAVMILGTIGDQMLHEPEFLPFFEAAESNDVPISVHVGFSSPGMLRVVDNLDFGFIGPFAATLHMGFLSIVMGGILDRFPRLKVSFLEGGCDWVVYLLGRMEERYRLKPKSGRTTFGTERSPVEVVRSGNVFIHCEVVDRTIPMVIDLIGDDCLLFASDMPHAHRYIGGVKILSEREDIDKQAVRKILQDNPSRFYGLEAPTAL